MRAVIAVFVVLVGIAIVAALKPELFFDVDTAAVGSSVSDELRGTSTMYDCQKEPGRRYRCRIGDIGSGGSGKVVVRLDDDRCWESLPAGRRNRNPGLSGCLGLSDYLFDDVPSLNE